MLTFRFKVWKFVGFSTTVSVKIQDLGDGVDAFILRLRDALQKVGVTLEIQKTST